MGAPDTAAAWFPYPAGPADATSPLLFCLHHGGGGASAYRDWQRLLGPAVEIVPVQLPGREGRLAEPAERSIAALTERLAGPLLERAGGRPYAFFGHSMGALLAYDLSHALTAAGRPPAHLAVSGYLPPHVRPAGSVHTLPEEEFLAHVAGLEGTPAVILENPTLLELVLPVLRDDFTACETYTYTERGPLEVPVAVFTGDADPGAPADMAARWGELTAAGATVDVFPGGHFYLQDRLPELLDALRNRLPMFAAASTDGGGGR
ncbi:thioesterase II family protein [Streptomyces sp. NPDC058486]|uniref:thioesterase II family protein n=1 Tax=unclassified Streptomyces TaxID=2593676 RepID=UPI0036482CF2